MLKNAYLQSSLRMMDNAFKQLLATDLTIQIIKYSKTCREYLRTIVCE